MFKKLREREESGKKIEVSCYFLLTNKSGVVKEKDVSNFFSGYINFSKTNTPKCYKTVQEARLAGLEQLR